MHFPLALRRCSSGLGPGAEEAGVYRWEREKAPGAGDRRTDFSPLPSALEVCGQYKTAKTAKKCVVQKGLI